MRGRKRKGNGKIMEGKREDRRKIKSASRQIGSYGENFCMERNNVKAGTGLK